MSCDKAIDVITQTYNLKEVDDCIAKLVPPALRGDFKQELFLILLETPCEKVAEIGGGLKYYTVRVILNLVRQKKNVYHKKYRDPQVVYDTDKLVYQTASPDGIDTIGDRITREQKELDMISALDDLPKTKNGMPYYKILVELIAELGSHHAASRHLGIPRRSISDSVQRVREHLKTVV